MAGVNMTARKQPVRRCTGCGEHFPKKELVRVVRLPDGNIALDGVGKMSGRGAYICKCAQCLNKAQKINALAKNFSMQVEPTVYNSLREEIEKCEK